MHPNEIPVVFTPRPGVTLPSKEFRSLRAQAGLLGPLHVSALFTQVERQVALVEAAAAPAVAA